MTNLFELAREIAEEKAQDASERMTAELHTALAKHEADSLLFYGWEEELKAMLPETPKTTEEALDFIIAERFRSWYFEAWKWFMCLLLFAIMFIRASQPGDVPILCFFWVLLLCASVTSIIKWDDPKLEAYQIKPRAIPEYFVRRDRRRALSELISKHREFARVVDAARRRIAQRQTVR